MKILLWIIATLAGLALVGLLVYLDWKAYFQRFPGVEWWTYFFHK